MGVIDNDTGRAAKPNVSLNTRNITRTGKVSEPKCDGKMQFEK